MPAQTAEIVAAPHIKPRTGRLTAVRQIFYDLRQRIVDLTMEPGTLVNSKDLAAEFGVSSTPVREAIILLSQEGLVEVVPQSRTSVSLIDVQHAWETHFLRASVEVEVVKTLARTISTDQLSNLYAWIDRQVQELKLGDQSAFKIADNELHAAMFAMAGVDGLTRLLDSRRGHYDRIRGLYLRVEERREIVVEEHRSILSALKAKDEAAAEAAVRQHLGKSLGIIDDIRDRHPDYFFES